ncbi:MAG: tRNA lysidine(34) synthetase TilS [Treponema sp.]
MLFTQRVVQGVYSYLEPYLADASVHFLIACSGGADSVALLKVFHTIQSVLGFRISVVTVNHNIRESTVSAADASFVTQFCMSLSPPIPCFVEVLPPGAVADCAQNRKRGIEDAARYLRYQCFENVAAVVHANFIVTAHNRNDVYETVLMRLFQGGSPDSLRKMEVRRGKYLRPFIDVDRTMIEYFLHEEAIVWREDSTNAENTYLRNKIRHFLIPALSSVFGQWHSGLDKTLRKIALDSSFCFDYLKERQMSFFQQDTRTCTIPVESTETQTASAYCSSEWQCHPTGGLTISRLFFDSLAPALRLRLVEYACSLLGVPERVPLAVLLRLVETSGKTGVSAAASLRMERRGERIFLFNMMQYRTLLKEMLYVLAIQCEGVYNYPLGQLRVYKRADGYYIHCTDTDTAVGPFKLPITVRGRQEGDIIQMSTGAFKSVKKIFNEWAVDSASRKFLPIVVEGSNLRALYGSPLGYPNWVVR